MNVHVGVLGCGTIGSAVATAILEGAVDHTTLSAIHTRTPDRAAELLDRLDATSEVQIVDGPGVLARRADVVVEAASQTAFADAAVPVLESGTDLVALSVGALRDERRHERVRTVARETNSVIRVPSGAVAGLDGVAALATSDLDSVSLVGRRPPAVLGPYVDDADALDDMDSGTVIFDGTAAEAAAAFPAHMNIAVAVSLAADLPPTAVEVRLILDHEAPRSIYTVEADGDAGHVRTTVENVTTPTPGDATHLVIQSTIATIERLGAPIVVGT
ncbi:MAG: aspartate dehydrogenase domain-containing protein [Salinirussus sp.]